MKITFLCKNYKLVNRGAERYVDELSKRLSDLGNKVNVLKNCSELKEKCDVVIGVNGRFDNFMARIWCWLNGAKLVIPGQSGLGFDDRLNLYFFPDVFIGFTDFQCNWAKKINPFVRVEKIPNGVDLKKFNPLVKPIKIGLPRPIVLSVGALEPLKRHDLVIKEVANTNESLLIVGRGKLKDELERLGNELIGRNKFRIMDFDLDQMPSVYTSVDRFVFSSFPWESFGIVILEARASGLPVSVTNDPIRNEILNTDINEYSWDKISQSYNNLMANLL